jgi:hypothetical protein
LLSKNEIHSLIHHTCDLYNPLCCNSLERNLSAYFLFLPIYCMFKMYFKTLERSTYKFIIFCTGVCHLSCSRDLFRLSVSVSPVRAVASKCLGAKSMLKV